MKILKLLRGDIYFQYKYGFYLLYALFTLIYIAILHFMPDSWQHIASGIIIFSDPALIGLVFMGAIVLFEKSERVLNTIAISPISVHHYVASKVLSISIISLISGLLIACVAAEIAYLPMFILGVSLGSIFFSLIGLIASVSSSTLNGFLIRICPIMALATASAVFYLFGLDHWAMQLLPSTAIINLIMDISNLEIISVVVLALWIVPIYCWTVVSVKNMMKKLGGVKI